MTAIDMGHGNGTRAVVSAADPPLPRSPIGPPDGRVAAGNDFDHDAKAARRLGRITGCLYLIIGVLGMFAGSVSTGLLVPGDPAATTDNVLASVAVVRGSLAAWIVVVLADVTVAITLYVLLEPAGATLSALAAAFRVAYAAILGINLVNLTNALLLLTEPAYAAGVEQAQVQALALLSLEGFGTGFKLGLIFFGAHLMVLGYLLSTSRYLPRSVGVLVVAAGIGYLADSLGSLFAPGYGGLARALPMVPAVVGELALTFWLVIKGVSAPKAAVASSPIPGARLGIRAGGVR